MKKTALVLLSIASVAGLVSAATAAPFTANNYQGFGNAVRAAGFNVSDVARGAGLGNVVPGGGFSTFHPGSVPAGGTFTPSGGAAGVHSLAFSPLSTPLAAVPEGGSSLWLLGAGLVALAFFTRRRMVSH